jgi:hypothetical protein
MLDKKVLRELEEFVESHLNIAIPLLESAPHPYVESKMMDIVDHEMVDFIKKKRKPSYTNLLFSFINQSGLKDSDIYKKAGLDRKHFSKIRSQQNYRPKKNTLLALAFALELSYEDIDKLLVSAGYSLSESDTFDLIIQFCIEKGIYNIHDVNIALDNFDLKPLI